MPTTITNVAVNNQSKIATIKGTSTDPSGTHNWRIVRLPNEMIVFQGSIIMNNGQWTVNSGMLSNADYKFKITSINPNPFADFSISDDPD